ncbi:PRTRC system protein F [Noviherbaspirillum sp. ST9]|uniref:PRTRC system protein F n=1 Tax=Noviherbaspirillum sp. ST9 TaxID=3401606 RepID=UPI003B588E4F
MNHALQLPRLEKTIPLSVVPSRLAAANAAVARFLIQAGAVREGDIPQAWDDALQVCERALDAWVKRELGALHCFRPYFSLAAVDEAGGYPSASCKEPVRYHKVDICWGECREQQWAVGDALEALERQQAGCGAAVLDVLREKSRFVYPLFTPDLACDVVSYVYWCGEENEEVALDMECGDNEDEREAMREEMVTRKKLDESFPAWVIATPRKRRLSRRALARLAQDASDPLARDIAADVLALATLRIEDEFRPDVDGEYIGFGAVLSWREDDLTVRIYDDLLQMAHQSEFCDRMGELEIAIDAPQAMRGWQSAMRVRFKTIRLLDRLIDRLSAGN